MRPEYGINVLIFWSESNVYNSNLLLWQLETVTPCVIMRYSAMAFGTDNTKSTAQLYHSNIHVFGEKKRILCMMSDAKDSINDSSVVMDNMHRRVRCVSNCHS